MAKKVLYPGTFDPITYGHLDVIKRALVLFGEVVVAVAPSERKATALDFKTRVQLVEQCCREFEGVQVVPLEGLTMQMAETVGASAVVRGVRKMVDFDYEMQLVMMNQRLASHIDTVFLPPSSHVMHISSGLVKDVAQFGGDLSAMVPEIVAEALVSSYQKK